jgi:hypothetical protein
MPVNLVNNLGTNYVLYYNVINYFKTIMKNHPSIQRVTYGNNFELDMDEFPQYPIGNVIITNARFQQKVLHYTVQLTIADKVKLKNDESIGSANDETVPFYGSDDTVDIHANTFSILNDLLTFTQRGTDALDIVTEPRAVPFKNEFPNALAGWVCTFDLEVFNQQDLCLYPNLLGTALDIKGVQTDC